MSLLTYSGITTKVRAMESRLFTEEQFREMAALEDVHSAADYLKQQPAYAGIFSGLDDSMLHRGNIERLLTLSLYRDFASLYRFGSLKQRRFLDLYFMHYEIDIMKRALRHVYSKQPAEMDLSEFREFFEKHSSIDLVALSQSESLEEFLSSLKGSIYYDLLAGLAENGKCSSFDYELQLDLFYFKSLWKIKNKILSKKELKILDECFGSKIDLLNIQWMYRSTQYYHLPAADIYSLLIPIRYRLKPEQINRMAEASTREEFLAAASQTVYGNLANTFLQKNPDADGLYRQIMARIYSTAGRKNPYSIAILNSYLFFNEREMHRIITILEGIRYGLSASEIEGLAAKQ